MLYRVVIHNGQAVERITSAPAYSYKIKITKHAEQIALGLFHLIDRSCNPSDAQIKILNQVLCLGTIVVCDLSGPLQQTRVIVEEHVFVGSRNRVGVREGHSLSLYLTKG